MNKNEIINISKTVEAYRNKERNFISISVHNIISISKIRKRKLDIKSKITGDRTVYNKEIQIKDKYGNDIKISLFSNKKEVLKL